MVIFSTGKQLERSATFSHVYDDDGYDLRVDYKR